MVNLPKLILISDEALKRPTILLLSDDLNAPSGIGTMSREFVFKTSNRINWIQIASSIEHPNAGKIIDISEQVQNETGYDSVSVKLYPYNGYGDSKILKYILDNEKVDGILHFTDPRYWNWLYMLEHEIRSNYKIPLMYYSIWDDLPVPFWNLNSYSSCDLLMAINKQTHILHQEVLKSGNYVPIDLRLSNMDKEFKESNEVLCDYIPHGIDENKFRPIIPGDIYYEEYSSFREKFVAKHNAKFIVFWNNRNIRRKQPGDVILAFKYFKDIVHSKHGEEAAKGCVLFMHTRPQDSNGTDLIAVKNAVAGDCQILFSVDPVDSKILNFYYNLADVTLNIASNEGFGLSNAESIMAGTFTVANVTGGLQDQMGFDFFPNSEIMSNHKGHIKEHGNWCLPVFPSNHSLQGSLETPYIFDDRVQPEHVADALYKTYQLGREDLKVKALEGRIWMIKTALMTADQMSTLMYKSIKLCLQKFKSKEKYQLIEVKRKETPSINGILVNHK